MEHKITNAFPHPSYDHKTTLYDIVVFKLEKPLVLDGRTTKAIELASRDSDLASGTNVFVSGFGKLNYDLKTIPTVLSGVVVRVVDRERCKEMYKDEGEVTDDKICAADVDKDSCNGDSGGPLVLYGTLVGIVSAGKNCASPQYPGLYTRIGHPIIYDFIKDVTKL